MPLKKYNTTSALLASTSSSSSTFLTHENFTETSPKISPTAVYNNNSNNNSNNSKLSSSPPPTTPSQKNFANQISSLSELLPNIIEAAAASGLNASSGSASATITPSSNKNVVTSTSPDYTCANYRLAYIFE